MENVTYVHLKHWPKCYNLQTETDDLWLNVSSGSWTMRRQVASPFGWFFRVLEGGKRWRGQSFQGRDINRSYLVTQQFLSIAGRDGWTSRNIWKLQVKTVCLLGGGFLLPFLGFLQDISFSGHDGGWSVFQSRGRVDWRTRVCVAGGWLGGWLGGW